MNKKSYCKQCAYFESLDCGECENEEDFYAKSWVLKKEITKIKNNKTSTRYVKAGAKTVEQFLDNEELNRHLRGLGEVEY